jgi:hypothetical protein
LDSSKLYRIDRIIEEQAEATRKMILETFPLISRKNPRLSDGKTGI